MQTKICTKCNKEKSINEFYTQKEGRFGVYSVCKVCKCVLTSDYIKANPEKHQTIMKAYYKTHIEKYKKRRKAYNKANKEKIKITYKKYYNANIEKIKATKKAYKKANKEKIKAQSKLYNEINKEKISAQGRLREKTYKKRRNLLYNQRNKTNPKFNLNNRISKAIRKSLNKNKHKSHWEELVGYTLEQLKKHLEKQFKDGMNWELFLEGKIHIDHKIPMSVFNYEKIEDEDFKKCWALENLQPLWDKDNLKKHAKLDRHFQPSLLFIDSIVKPE